MLLQALEEELPRGTIHYSSMIVSIEEDDNINILHLADGTVLISNFFFKKKKSLWTAFCQKTCTAHAHPHLPEPECVHPEKKYP